MNREFGHSRRCNRIIIDFIDISGEYIKNQVHTLSVPSKSHMFINYSNYISLFTMNYFKHCFTT